MDQPNTEKCPNPSWSARTAASAGQSPTLRPAWRQESPTPGRSGETIRTPARRAAASAEATSRRQTSPPWQLTTGYPVGSPNSVYPRRRPSASSMTRSRPVPLPPGPVVPSVPLTTQPSPSYDPMRAGTTSPKECRATPCGLRCHGVRSGTRTHHGSGSGLTGREVGQVDSDLGRIDLDGHLQPDLEGVILAADDGRQHLPSLLHLHDGRGRRGPTKAGVGGRRTTVKLQIVPRPLLGSQPSSRAPQWAQIRAGVWVGPAHRAQRWNSSRPRARPSQ